MVVGQKEVEYILMCKSSEWRPRIHSIILISQFHNQSKLDFDLVLVIHVFDHGPAASFFFPFT